MRLFSGLMDRVLEWSRHRHAPWYLGGLSFAESSFFPIPPDVMLAPMVLAKPETAWRLAGITTVTSVAGGIAGYLIGVWAMDMITPVLHDYGYWEAFEKSQVWFREWGFWAVLAAGFSPIPYKIFTIAAGAMSMMFAPFVLASAVGRGARFFMVAALMAWGGPRFEEHLRRYIDIIGWACVVLGVVVYLLLSS
ncbi:MAG: YqaA family protein [Gammaproteobacteria bacterium]